MKLSAGYVLILMLALAAWAPAAYALDYSFGVQNEDNAFAHAVLVGPEDIKEMVSSANGIGDTATAYWGVSGPWGPFVATLHRVDGLPYAKAWVELNVGGADHIIAGANSSSHNGQKAEVSTEVFDGSLLNYNALAYADPDMANATQSFSIVQGADITIKNSASNTEKDSVNVSTEAFNGIIGDYSSSASAYSDRASAYQDIANFAYCDKLLLRSNASNSANANGWAKTGLYVENGAIVSASGNATSDKTDAYADNWVNSATGEKIEAGWFAGEGYKGFLGSNFAAMSGIKVKNGYYTGHSAAEYIYKPLSKSQASGLQAINESQGDEILFGAQGITRGPVIPTMISNVTGNLFNGGMSEYVVTNATATANNAGAGITSSPDSTIWGTFITLNNSAWNTEGDIARGWTNATNNTYKAFAKSYNSSAWTEAHAAHVTESSEDVSGTDVVSVWNASSRYYGESLSGQIHAYEPTNGYANLSVNKLTKATTLSTTSRQIMYATGALSQVLNVDALWNAANTYYGEKITGSAHLKNSMNPLASGMGFLSFDSLQTIAPTKVDASTTWSAAAGGTTFSHYAPFDRQPNDDQVNMTWTATDRYGDIAQVEGYGGWAALDGNNTITAGLSSAEASSRLDGTGIVVGFQDYAKSYRGEFAGLASLVVSPSFSGCSLSSNNYVKGTVGGIGATAYDYYDLGTVYNPGDIFWTYALANNSEGDTVQMFNEIGESTTASSIVRTLTSGPTSVKGIQTVEFTAKTFENLANATNAKGYYAEANVSSTTDTETHAKHTDTVTATSSAVSAAQSNFDAHGSLFVGGYAQYGSAYADSFVNITNGLLTSRTSRYSVNVVGPTAYQSISADAANGGRVDFNWSARDTLGNRVNGSTLMYSGQITASDLASAVVYGVLSAKGNDSIKSTGLSYHEATAWNARKDLAKVWVNTTLSDTYADYSSSVTATTTASSASQATTSNGYLFLGCSAGQLSGPDKYNQFAGAAGYASNGNGVTSSSSVKSDASGATSSQTFTSNTGFGQIWNEATAGRGYSIGFNRLNNFTAFSGATVTSGNSLTSTVKGSALWSGSGASRALTATATQVLVADATGGQIDLLRGAVYTYNATSNAFTGGAQSNATITQGRILANGLSDSAVAKNNSATVTSVKFNVQGNKINRRFSAYSEAGSLWMQTNVAAASGQMATLTDSSYTASATPTLLSLSGKWTATNYATVQKIGRAHSINWPPAYDDRVTQTWLGTSTIKATNVVDTGSVTKTTHIVS